MVERYKFHRKLWYGRKSIVFFFCLLFTSLSLYAQEGTLHYGYLKLDGVEIKGGNDDGNLTNYSLVFRENVDGTLTLTQIMGNEIPSSVYSMPAYAMTKEEFIAQWKEDHKNDEKYSYTDDYYSDWYIYLKYNGQYDGRFSNDPTKDATYWANLNHVIVGDDETSLYHFQSWWNDSTDFKVEDRKDVYIERLDRTVKEPLFGLNFVDPDIKFEDLFWEYDGDYYWDVYNVNEWNYRVHTDDDGNYVVQENEATDMIPLEYYEVMTDDEIQEYLMENYGNVALLESDAEDAWNAAVEEFNAAGGAGLLAYREALATATTIEFPSVVDGKTVTAINLENNNTSINVRNNLTTIVLPTTLESITYFGNKFYSAFSFSASAITNINLHELNNLKIIGDYGMSYFESYSPVLSMTSVKNFGEYAFYDTPITFSNLDLTGATVGEGAFSGTTVREAHFKNTTSSGSYGIITNNKWSDIYIDDETSMMDPSIFFGSNMNPSLNATTRIIVPDNLYDTYAANSVWQKVLSNIKKKSETVVSDYGDVEPAGFSSVNLTGETHYASLGGYKDVLIFKEDDKGNLYFAGIGYPIPTDEEKNTYINTYIEDHPAETWPYNENVQWFKYIGNSESRFEATSFTERASADQKKYVSGEYPIYCGYAGFSDTAPLAPNNGEYNGKNWWALYKEGRNSYDILHDAYYIELLGHYPYYDQDYDFLISYNGNGVITNRYAYDPDNIFETYKSDLEAAYLKMNLNAVEDNGYHTYMVNDVAMGYSYYLGFGPIYGEGGVLLRDVSWNLGNESCPGISNGKRTDKGGVLFLTGQVINDHQVVGFTRYQYWDEVGDNEVKEWWEANERNKALYNAKNAWQSYLASNTYKNTDNVQAFIEYIQSATTITIPSSVDGKTVVGVNWTECISENLNSMLTVNLPTSATKIIAMPANTKLPAVTTVNLSSMSNLREVGGFKNYSTLTGTYNLSQVKTYRNEAFSGCTGMRITKVDLKDGEVGMTPFVGVTVDELVYQNTKANGTNIRMLSGIKDCKIYIKEDSVMNANRFLAMEGDEYTLQSGCTVYVPCPLVTEYKAAAGWKDIANQIEAYGCDYYVIVDGEEKYEGVIYVDGSTPSTLELKKTSTETGLTLQIPQSLTVDGTTYTVTGIAGGGACKDRTDYTKVILPETVTTIGDDAFNGCSNVAEINLDNVTVYGANAMKGCSSLTIHADFHNVTSIGSGAFQNSGLQSVWLRTLGDASEERSNVFAGCPNLRSIYLDQDDPTVVNPSHLGISSGSKTAIFVSCTNVVSAYTGSVKNPIEMYHLNDNWGKADYWNSVYPMLHQVGGVEQGRKFSTFCFDKPIDFTGKTIKNTEHCIEGMLQYYLQPENNTTGFIDNRIEPLVVTGYTYQGGVEPNAGGDVSDESGSLTVANPGPRPAYTGILVRWHHDDEFNNASGLQEFYPLPPVRDANGYILYNQESFHTAYPEAKSGTFVHEGEVNSGARNKFHDGSYVDQDAAGTRSYNETSGVYTGEGFSNLLIGVTEKTDSIYYYPWFYAIATDGNGHEIVEGGKPVLDTNNKSFDTHYKQFMLNGDQKRFQRCARMTENERMSGSWLRPYRAYLRLPILADGKTTTDGAGGEGAAAPIKAYFYIDENNGSEATTISLKELTEGLMPEGLVYNMSGLKVSDHGLDGLAPGLYIMNGKKVVKKK